jgi:glucose-6-phosphate 1-dehydrogenase
VVLGQYTGYLDVPNVTPNSNVPTYVALKVLINNWNWAGVPFYIRAGKKLASKLTNVAVHFKSIPTCLLGKEKSCEEIRHDILTLEIEPNAGISLSLMGKVPGDGLPVGEMKLSFDYSEGFSSKPREAYERLILDLMRGDHLLFASREGVELEWKFVMPIIETWESGEMGRVFSYFPGSEGPDAANQLIERDGHTWTPLK